MVAYLDRAVSVASMKRTGWIVVGMIVTAGLLLFSLPFWGMGTAVFLDSSRTVISSLSSPDGRRVAEVESLVVGGVPSIVVTVRSSGRPDWYLWSCAAASHYHETSARIVWTSPRKLEVSSSVDPLNWQIGTAPFHNQPCSDLSVSVVKG